MVDAWGRRWTHTDPTLVTLWVEPVTLECVSMRMDTRALIAALRGAGWEEVRVTGDHHFFRHPTRPGLINVPHPKKQLPIGTLRSIEKLSGLRLRTKS